MEGHNKSDLIKDQLVCVFCEVILPDKVCPDVLPPGAGKPEQKLLDMALKEVKRKVTEIIMNLEVVSSDTLRVCIPDEQYLRFMLQAEYMYYASLSGRKNVFRHVRTGDEDESDIMRKFMHSYGLSCEGSLKKYERRIRKYLKSSGSDEQQIHETLHFMRYCLQGRSSKE